MWGRSFTVAMRMHTMVGRLQNSGGTRGRTGGGISELREMGSLEWVGIEGRERVLMEEVVRARGEGPVNRATD